MASTRGSYGTSAKKRANLAGRTGASRRATTKGSASLKYGGIGDAAVKKATGRTWSEWRGVLDRAGAAKMAHKDIVILVHEKYKVGDWWSQMVTVGYEQARGLREKHQKPDGYEISGSKTVAVPLGTLFGAWLNANLRKKWLNAGITIRRATPKKSMRMTWSDGRTSVDANFYAKGTGKSMVSLNHRKLSDAAAAKKMKTYWATRLARLQAMLEN